MSTVSMILGNERRKLLVEFLNDSDGKSELRNIVDFIAEKEGNISNTHKKSVYVSLVQTHIPKMRRAGVVDFEGGVVELIGVPDDVTVYMEMVKKNDISWSTFYAVVSVIFVFTAIFYKNYQMALASGVYLLFSILQHIGTVRILKKWGW
jgi:hypothetical protein